MILKRNNHEPFIVVDYEETHLVIKYDPYDLSMRCYTQCGKELWVDKQSVFITFQLGTCKKCFGLDFLMKKAINAHRF
jgi:hypothetical protein